MTQRSPFVSIVAGTLVVCGVCYGAWRIVTGTSPEKKSSKPAPAAVVKKISEGDLGTIVLSEEAEQRLGVSIAEVETKKVGQVRVYGGEVMVPLGHTIAVFAPMGGALQAPASGLPKAGQPVSKGQPILSLLPLFSPEASTTLAASRAEVDGQVKNAQTQLAAMKLALDRAKRLYSDEAGSKRSVEESQAQHDLALRAVEAAETRFAILSKALGDASTGRSTPIPITSPETGILRNLSALPGQNVPGGGALFEVVDLSEVWVRVAVYVGDLPEIATDSPAQVGGLSMKPGERTWSANLVSAPPSANPLTATVDIFYALTNDKAQLTPGQRVGVELLLKGQAESVTLPWSAVIHDVHGGTWVYERIGLRTYRRERVQVRYALNGVAVLASGPSPGAKVVSEGAIELFGAETGFSK